MMINLEKPPLEELVHFGILGMHWGKRKAEPEPKSQDRVSAEKKVDQTKGKLKSRNTRDNSLQYKYAKQDLASVKILEKIKAKGKSQAQVNLETKYKAKGMTNDEAAVAAYKNIQTKKVLITVGAMTMAAVAGYAAYKIHNDRADKLIKSNTLLQNITNDPTASIRDSFYAATDKTDKVKYQGLFGNQLTARGPVYKKEVQVLKDIKRASPKAARETFFDLVKKDPDFSKEFGTSPSKKAYDLFNQNLVDHSPANQNRINKYYSALHNKGYNAILDVNDMKFSGYKAKSPTIYFNMKDLVTVSKNETLTRNLITDTNTKVYGDLMKSAARTQAISKGAMYTGAILAMATTAKVTDKKQIQKSIETYQKENPNTKLSYTEIGRMLERGNA